MGRKGEEVVERRRRRRRWDRGQWAVAAVGGTSQEGYMHSCVPRWIFVQLIKYIASMLKYQKQFGR